MPSTAHASSRAAAARRRLTLTGLSRIDETLEFTFGNAVAEFCAPGPEAAELPLAEPTPHRFGGRTESFGHLTHREQTLFVHRVPEAAFRRGCPSQWSKKRRSVVRSPQSTLQDEPSCGKALFTRLPGCAGRPR